jgi:eukaryotic-like serine/threonine-protein kinase
MPKTHMDSQTFVANVRLSGLIPEDELDAALERVPYTERGRSVARALIQLGLLTKFQAQLLLVGRTHGFVLGQYRILDQLGEGGMGRVFKAEHMTMGRTVAIKVLAPQHTKTDKARQLFTREVRASGKLMHPNIVTAHDANEIDGRHYLVMEYIDGPNLDQLVRERGPLPVGLACDIVRQAASGLQCAFEHGMVHRDIKPSNLLLQRIGTTLSSGYLVKILDFGLARLGDAVEVTNHSPKATGNVVMGTPDYLSPEQARDLHLVDIRSDLYSLGCTFYFLLTGQVPFPGGTTIEKLQRHTKDEPLPVEQLRPDLPHEVADIVLCLLAKEPVNRYQTPAELVMELVPHAAPMPSAWASSRQTTSPSADTLHQQANTHGLALDLEDKMIAGPPDRKSALAVGLPDDLLPAPLSLTDVRLLPPGQRARTGQWTLMAASAAVGLAIGALSAGLVLWFLQ